MKPIRYILIVLIKLCLTTVTFAQTYTRTGFQQDWLAGTYKDKTRTIIEFSGPIGFGVVTTNSKDTLGSGGIWLPVQKDFTTTSTDSVINISKLWNPTNSTFINQRKQRTNLDPVTHKPVLYLEQHWNGTLWQNTAQNVVQYDANNFKTGEIQSIWNGAWQVTTRVVYFNNVNGKPVATHRDSLKAGNWDTFSIDSATYDANGNQTEVLTLYKFLGVLTRSTKIEMSFNTNNELVSSIVYLAIGNLWVPNQKTTYLSVGDLLYNQDFQFNLVFPPANPVWTNIGRIIWSPAVTPVGDNLTKEPVVLYPNPATSFISLRGLSGNPVVRILSPEGREVYSTTAQNEISVSQLPSGIYFLEVPASGIRKVFIKK